MKGFYVALFGIVVALLIWVPGLVAPLTLSGGIALIIGGFFAGIMKSKLAGPLFVGGLVLMFGTALINEGRGPLRLITALAAFALALWVILRVIRRNRSRRGE